MRWLLLIILLAAGCLFGLAQPDTDSQVLFQRGDSLAKAKAFEESKRVFLQIMDQYEMRPEGTLPGAPEILAYRRYATELRFRNGLGDSSVGFFLKSTRLWERNPIDSIGSLVLDNFNHIIIHHGSHGRLDSALVYGQQALDFASQYQIAPCTELSALHQNLSICHRIGGADRKSHEAALRSILVSKKAGEAPGSLARSYLNFGRTLAASGVYARAVAVLDTAIVLFKSDTATEVRYLVDALIRKASALKEQGHYDKSLVALDEAKEIKSAGFDSDDEQMAYIMHFYSAHYDRLHDFERALDYQQRIVGILEKYRNDPEIYTDLAVARSNLGDVYQSLEQHDMAREEYETCLEMFLKTGLKDIHLSHAYRNLGLHFAHINKPAEALAQFELAGQIVIDRYGLEHDETAHFYEEYAGLVSDLAMGDTALLYYRRARSVLAHNQLSATGRMIPIWYHLGELFARAQQPDSATYAFEQVLDLANYQEGKPHLLEDGMEKYCIDALRQLGLLYQTEPQKALSYYKPAEQILTRTVKQSLVSETAKLRSLESTYVLYADIQKAYLALGQNDEAMGYADKAKTPLLRTHWLETEAVTKFALPKQLLEEQRQIRSEIHSVESKLSGLDANTPDFQSRKARLLTLQAELDESYATMRSEYPEFEAYLELQSDCNIQKVLADFPDDMALLEYFIGDTEAHVYLVYQGTLQIISFDPAEIDSLTQVLAEFLANPSRPVEELWSTSARLSQLVLFDALQALPTLPVALLIIPDGTLQMIPFEICFANAEDAKEGTQLLRRCAVSYATSVCGLSHQQRSNPGKNLMVGGYAPLYSDGFADTDTTSNEGIAMLVRSGHFALPGAQREAQDIVDIFGGDLFAGDLATKQTFIETSPDYRILHLSMHALPDFRDPDFSRLLFHPSSDEREYQMTTGEIRNLSLNAELVVLSACQTGIGQLHKGEGVQSLSRAFAMAGATSAVTSLWKVPDESSAQIMVAFYQYLQQGVPKHEALRKAKLDYLDKVKFDAQKHPVFWAGFVLSGNHDPIVMNSGLPKWWMILGGLVAILLVGYFFLRKDRASV